MRTRTPVGDVRFVAVVEVMGHSEAQVDERVNQLVSRFGGRSLGVTLFDVDFRYSKVDVRRRLRHVTITGRHVCRNRYNTRSDVRRFVRNALGYSPNITVDVKEWKFVAS